MAVVTESVGQLERFPMTMELLQITRVGKLLNTIRKQTDRLLQNRIRHIIRCWQELVKKDYTHQSITPKNIRFSESGIIVLDSVGSAAHANGNNGKLPLPRSVTVTQLDRLSSNSLPVSPALSQNSAKSTPCNEKHSSDYIVNSLPLKVTNNKRKDRSLITNDSFTSSPKRRKHEDASSSTSVVRISSTPVINKHSHVNRHPHTANGFVEHKITPNHRSNQSLRLESNVDPDARSITSDSSTAHNQPTLNIAPKVQSTTELLKMYTNAVKRDTVTKILTNEISKEPEMPESALPESARPRQYKSKLQKQNSKLSSQDESNNDSVSAAKSEILAKFLNNTIEFQTSSTEPSVHSLEKPRLTSTTSQGSDSHMNVETPPDDPPLHELPVKRHKKHKKKRLNKKSPLPVTNYLDDIPDLPPLPDNIDWHSLDYVNDKCHIDDLAVIPRLLTDNWPGVNCVVDDSNKPIPNTDTYSVALPERGVHLLPWTDLNGWQGQFLPNEDDYVPPPDPW